MAHAFEEPLEWIGEVDVDVGRRIDEGETPIEIAVVVARDLGDEVDAH